MLPFSNLAFFALAFLIVAGIYLLKPVLEKTLRFDLFLCLVNALYFMYFFSKPLHVLVFIVFSYIVFYFASYILKNQKRLLMCILLAFPMLLVKLELKNARDIIPFAGLSYMTFRLIQLYIDSNLYAKRISFVRFFTFVTFFPTMLAGPIDKYDRFEKDLDTGYASISLENLLKGIHLLLTGVFQKFVCAEIISRYWLNSFDTATVSLKYILANIYGYGLFMYFDFAGYSLMAIGLGKMMGIEVPINFDKPFLSINPQDFWRRFHITLGTWLKDYFFKPIYKALQSVKGLGTHPLFKQNISLFLTFFLMGIWNGIHWNYIASGSLFGLYSVIHNTYLFYVRKTGKDIFNLMPKKVAVFISIFLMVNAAFLALYLFSGLVPLAAFTKRIW